MSENTQLTTVSNTLRWALTEIDRDPHLKSANTRRGYRHDLAQFEAWRDGRPMTKGLVEEYQVKLQREGKSPNTINRILSAVRWLSRRMIESAHDSLMPTEEREEVIRLASRIASVEDDKGTRPQKGRMIGTGELDALMTACAKDKSAAGTRDAAIIALAWFTGARRQEIADLTLENIEWTSDTDATVHIIGKGDKAREDYLYNGAALAMRDWLSLRGNDAGSLFLAIDKAGRIIRDTKVYGVRGDKGSKKAVEPGMSDEGLAFMLAKRVAQAKLSKHTTWHDFRRTFISVLLTSNDVVTVQHLAGHASPVTTSAYDRRGKEAQQKAVQGLHVPYESRE